MDRLAASAIAPWGIAAVVFLVVAIVALVGLGGRVRWIASAAALATAVVLVALSMATAPDGRGESDAAIAPLAQAPGGTSERAQALIADAERQLNRGDTDGARDSYDRARALYLDADDVLGEAGVAFGLGRLEHVTGQSDAARANYADALSLYRDDGSTLGQARVLAALGDLEKDTFNWNVARQHYRDARTAWDTAPEPKSDPHVLLGLEALPVMPDGEAKARADLGQAKKLYETVDDLAGIGDVAMVIGDLETNLGNFDAARLGYANARVTYLVAGEPWKEGHANLRLGLAEIQSGNNVDGHRALELAAFLFNKVEDATGRIRVLVATGDLERLQGRLDVARGHYVDALEPQILTGRDAPDALTRLGEVEAQLGYAEAAGAALAAAAQKYGALGIDGGEARASLSLGHLALERKQLVPAQDHLARAQALFDADGNLLGAGRAQLGLADIAEASQQAAIARHGYLAAGALFEKAGAQIGRVLAQLALGDLERGLDAGTAAATAYLAANSIFKSLETPVADANRYLGLPAVQLIGVRFLFDEDIDYTPAGFIDEQDEVIPDRGALEAMNLEAFPDHNAEGHALIADLEVRLGDAMQYVAVRG